MYDHADYWFTTRTFLVVISLFQDKLVPCNWVLFGQLGTGSKLQLRVTSLSHPLDEFSWIYFFPRRAFWDLFFLGECILRFIFSRGRPFDIYFFPEKGLWFFFLNFLWASPQISVVKYLILGFHKFLGPEIHRTIWICDKINKKKKSWFYVYSSKT